MEQKKIPQKSLEPQVIKECFKKYLASHEGMADEIDAMVLDFYQTLPTLTREPLAYFVANPEDLAMLIFEKFFILAKTSVYISSPDRWFEFSEAIKEMYFLRMETFENEVVAKGKPCNFS